jgi:diguanylate cyclase (GGDEF)-like protein
MIERSRRAEHELAETAREVETLRQELDSARDDATKDALTGLANRRAIDAQLAQLADAGTPRLLAICDVDHFKSVNDRFGHAIGDRVLTAIADALSEACAPHSVGTLGAGEEFLVVMPETGLEEGRALLDSVRQDLGMRNFKLRETDQQIGTVTFSAGMALAKGDAGRTSPRSAAPIRSSTAPRPRAGIGSSPAEAVTGTRRRCKATDRDGVARLVKTGWEGARCPTPGPMAPPWPAAM